ncbi:MAG TPA: rhomboid family intramembrane serine protease [Kofleriaceae bacterium]|jgi:membrane associated rhomboid family serine protease
MIVPLGIDHKIRGLPWVTISIIAICTLVQIDASYIAPSMEDLARATDDQQLMAMLDHLPIWRLGYETGSGVTWRLVSCAFVHAGWWHLIGNMLFLWLAGAALEDRWGRVRFALFFVVGAAAATLCYDWFSDEPGIRLVGASGAIAALMGAFLVCFTRTQIIFGYWWFVRAGIFRMSAALALPLWLGDQFLSAYLAGHDPGGFTSIAYGAHIGGFVFGAIVAVVAKLVSKGDDALERDDDDDAVPAARVVRIPAAVAARFEQCLEAIRTKETSAVRTQASRAILDLARAGDRERVLEIFRSIAASMASMPLTDGALAAAADAAEALHRDADYLAIATALGREHPYSLARPKVMWRLAQLHRAAARTEQERAVLTELAQRFPRDPYGQKAKSAL